MNYEQSKVDWEEQKKKDKIFVVELFKLAYDNVVYQIEADDYHPHDAALNSFALLETFIERRI